MKTWLVIGVGGVTCGGKTTLSTAIKNFFLANRNSELSSKNIIIGDTILLNQDDYFLPIEDSRQTWVEELNHINWEILSALDMDRMIEDIRNILGENFILYSKFHSMMMNDRKSNESDYIIECSDLQLPNNSEANHHNFHEDNNYCNMGRSFHVEDNITEDSNIVNVLILEGFLIFNHPQLLQLSHLKFHLHLPYEICYGRRRQRVYNPPDVTGYFEMCVWPMYEKHFNEIRDGEDIQILNGLLSKDKLYEYSLKQILNVL